MGNIWRLWPSFPLLSRQTHFAMRSAVSLYDRIHCSRPAEEAAGEGSPSEAGLWTPRIWRHQSTSFLQGPTEQTYLPSRCALSFMHSFLNPFIHSLLMPPSLFFLKGPELGWPVTEEGSKSIQARAEEWAGCGELCRGVHRDGACLLSGQHPPQHRSPVQGPSLSSPNSPVWTFCFQNILLQPPSDKIVWGNMWKTDQIIFIFLVLILIWWLWVWFPLEALCYMSVPPTLILSSWVCCLIEVKSTSKNNFYNQSDLNHHFLRCPADWIAAALIQFCDKLQLFTRVKNVQAGVLLVCSLKVVTSPRILPNHTPNITSLLFQGYSFIAPSILFNKNAVMGDFVESQVCADRPGSASVQRSAMLQVWIVFGLKK